MEKEIKNRYYEVLKVTKLSQVQYLLHSENIQEERTELYRIIALVDAIEQKPAEISARLTLNEFKPQFQFPEKVFIDKRFLPLHKLRYCNTETKAGGICYILDETFKARKLSDFDSSIIVPSAIKFLRQDLKFTKVSLIGLSYAYGQFRINEGNKNQLSYSGIPGSIKLLTQFRIGHNIYHLTYSSSRILLAHMVSTLTRKSVDEILLGSELPLCEN